MHLNYLFQNNKFNFSSLLLFFLLGIATTSVQANKFKVLVVMSYEEDNPWCIEIKNGVDSVLESESLITYQYMDTKVNHSGGEQKAERAFAVYQQLNPDGVIAIDDNAQSMFVLPYLKDKVDTPIMFSGVNAAPEKYGYPTANISGILERPHIRESIAYLQQLSPSVSSISFIVKDSPSGTAVFKQIEEEKDSYMADVEGFYKVKNTDELLALAKQLNDSADAVFMISTNGIMNNKNGALNYTELLDLFKQEFKGPILGGNKFHVESGVLAAVAKTGQEQGETAARMLLDAMNGLSVSEIPVVKNYQGKRMINVTTMKLLGIKAKPEILRGTTLVK